jgi:signal transduction histidine kinase
MNDLYPLFPGESEMASRMRVLDWSTTSMPHPTEWPEELRQAVKLCLTSGIAIAIFWGPDFNLLYNDAYISFLGSKHPSTLGQPCRESWPEIWSFFEETYNNLCTSGKTTWSKDVPLFFSRRLPLEEVFVSFTFGPILGDDGRTIKGLFCPCVESTEQVINEQRLETLRKLSMHTSDTKNIPMTCKQSAEIISQHPEDISFAAIYVPDNAHKVLNLTASVGLHNSLVPDSVPIVSDKEREEFAFIWPIASVFSEQATEIINDFSTCKYTLPGGKWPEPTNQVAILPIPSAAKDTSPAGVIILGVSPRRVFDESYCSFFSLVAGHIGNAVSHATIYQAEQDRAKEVTELNEAKTRFFNNISHELKTPLTLILSPIEDAFKQLNTPILEGKNLSIVHRNALRLMNLVNTLLDFSRVEASGLKNHHNLNHLDEFTRKFTCNSQPIIAKESNELTPPHHTPTSPDLTARILIVEDNEDMRDYLVRLLQERWQIETAAHGGIALEKLYRKHFDLILTDVMMPVVDGYHLIQAVRADNLLNEIPIIVLSACAETEKKIAGLDIGADDYLIKPFSAREVLARIQAQLKIATRNQLAYENQLLRKEKEIAEKNSRAKDHFLMTLSHELRTPLSAILCWTHALKENLNPNHKLAKAALSIEKSALIQNQLVNDLLDVSNVILGKVIFKPERTNLVSIIKETISLFEEEFKKKQITFNFITNQEEVWLLLDVQRTRQVFNNLITNALKFSEPLGLIEIGVEEKEVETLIYIKDTGRGINPTFLPYIFERFTQEYSHDKNNSNGLGLGLSLVHDFIHLQGGRVQALSNGAGQGTTFLINFPSLMSLELV